MRMAVTEVRSASFGLVLHVQQLYVDGMALYWPTLQFYVCVTVCTYHLLAGAWRPLVSVITTRYDVVIIFHRQVWYRTLSLHYACIRHSHIIPIL